MSWQERIAISVMLLGFGAGAFLVAQRASFWIRVWRAVGKSVAAAGVARYVEEGDLQTIPTLYVHENESIAQTASP